MPFWSRILNVFRPDAVNREIDEELQAHLEEAVEAGRDPDAARRAFGSTLRTREESRDIRLASWLDSLRADVVFGWRQLLKNRVTSGAAILSLALAVGACTSAFRLIDAALLRPLPVAEPERLYVLTYEERGPGGKTDTADTFEYPLFRDLRSAVKDKADLMAIGYAGRNDLTYSSDTEMEKAYRQYVSGSLFGSFGLKPALGRLLTPADDVTPGGHPCAVLSYDYWTRRFGRDPKAVGRTFRMGEHLYQIVGVSQKGFTGTETGTLTDVFVPTMMNAQAINDPNSGWFRTWLRLKPGVASQEVREQLQGIFSELRREKAKNWTAQTSKELKERYVTAPLFLEPAAAGVSGMQKKYRQSLVILAVVVLLVLLIACANVANLMTAQAASRAKEMALRISIGAGRLRLLQLVLVESALMALVALALGALFAWWSAPLVVGMINPPDDPARLILSLDWRVVAFTLALTLAVTFLFGLAPALRASAVQPVGALKGGDDPHSRRRLMNSLIAAQVAFCFLVHFVSGLFVATFDRMSNQPTGFSTERLLVLDTVAVGKRPTAYWDQITQHLRSITGVESAALSGWAPMSGSARSFNVSVAGRPPEDYYPYFLPVSSGWMDVMKIPLLRGRDFNSGDTHPDVALVNETFAKHYFDGQDPVGRIFTRSLNKKEVPTRIIGQVRDARYRNMREPIRATVYLPFHAKPPLGEQYGSFLVRTAAADPGPIVARLRQEVPNARSEFRVSNIRTQAEIVRQHALRERLLATLSLFFAVVALVLAATGLYGVLNYSVLQRRREIGIRIALGAQAGHVARRVTAEVFTMLLIGAGAGLAAGIASEQYLETLLYEVKATDLTMLAVPAVTIFAAALLASLPPILRAVRIDPAATLRAE